MTNNTAVLQDVLCRRIANGNASSLDLPLLERLLLRASRRSLLLGGGTGILVGALLAIVAVLLLR